MFILSFSDWTVTNIIIRIIASLLLGCLIGLDIGVKKRGAGAKTSSIICLGATLIMLTAQYMDIVFPEKTDISRMAAQVISGVGFLGVGTIIVSGHQIKGLTTAASLWACACIGLATGIGLIDISVIITLLMIVILHALPAIEKYLYEHSKYFGLYIDLENNHVIPKFLEACKAENIEIDSFDVTKPKSSNKSVSIIATIKIPDFKKSDYYMSVLENIEGVIFIEII